ncbi:MAG: hypothetical protein J6H20_04545 [Pyramidobacter sp.]|nr:hypothetical protein [Pyramidobacter sp.]MBP3836509.1 hypothetical protein [Pyramidobacter sp.]
MSERNELILFAVWDRVRLGWRFAACERTSAPLPLNAHVICQIDREDRALMIEWATQKAQEGWTLRRIREACAR